MEIKGPTGSVPVDIEPTQVGASTASRESRNAAAAPSQSVLLKLSPNLFKLGQVLNVIVAKVEQNALLLTVQNKFTDQNGTPLNIQLRAPRAANIEAGQRLQVEVTDLKQNIPSLKVIDSQRPALVLTDLLNQAQIKQQPLQQLLNNLIQVKTSQGLFNALPKEVTEKIDTLWRALPEQSQMQRSNNVKHAIQYAGPFLESQLLKLGLQQNRFFPAMDTKNNLLRLAEALRQQNNISASREAHTHTQTTTPLTQTASTTTTQASQPTSTTAHTAQAAADNKAIPVPTKVDPNIPTPPAKQSTMLPSMNANQILELLTQQTEGSLQRTLTQQLQMLNADNLRQQLIFELPVKHGNNVDVFDMRIHPDQQGHQQDTDQARPWTIMMAFDLEGLGPIRAQISLFNERISTHWWAEQPNTVELFQLHMEALQNRLSQVGLEVDKVRCQQGVPTVAAKAQQKSLYTDVNLDEKA